MPKDLPFNRVKDMLKKHFDQEPILIAEGFNFYQQNQNAGESIGDYLAVHRRLHGEYVQWCIYNNLIPLFIWTVCTFNKVKDTLKKHFDQEPILTAKEFHFDQRNQNTGESISDYLAVLTRLYGEYVQWCRYNILTPLFTWIVCILGPFSSSSKGLGWSQSLPYIWISTLAFWENST